METQSFKDYPEIMTISEVAGYLRISLSTVYQMTQVGTLPAFKVGRQWRFYKTDIEKFLKSGSPVHILPQKIRRNSLIFDAMVLMYYHYFPHQVKKTPKGGWVMIKTDENDKSSLVVRIRFRKIRLTDGKEAIVLTRSAFARIPKNHHSHWQMRIK